MKKAKILIAQTDSEILTIIKAVLNSENFDITIVTNGNEAIQKISFEKFDLVICELTIPGYSGSEVANYMRRSELNADSAFTLLTGTQNPKLVGELFGMKKIDSYVPEPVTFRQISSHIQMMLNTTRRRQSKCPVRSIII